MNPDWKHTVHCIGDLHAGAITRARMEALSGDIEQLGPPALHLQVGDATEGGKEHEDGLAREFLDELPGQWVTALAPSRTGAARTGSARRTSRWSSTSSA